jgi:hypothetical protein
MKRYSTIMSVLLTLALPVAGIAEIPKTPEKPDASIEAKKEATSKGGESTKDAASKEEPSKGAASKGEPAKGAASKGGHPKTIGAGAPAAEEADRNPSGKVVETMDGGGYTYAKLEKGGKETWVAFPVLETRVGASLSFRDCMEMNAFESKALKRKFDSILFCGSPQVKQSAKAKVGDGKKSPGSGGAATPATGKVKVEKASGPNAYTVAEIFEKRAALHGKQVVVRGQVVKVSTGIMNKNWIHLQDGSGSEAKKTNNLVVTSNDEPQVGAVVTVSGTLTKDKDFGSGYKYNAIIEKGSVKK